MSDMTRRMTKREREIAAASVIVCRRCGQNAEEWRTVCTAATHVAVREARRLAGEKL